MKKILLLVLLITLACAPKIATVDQAFEEIHSLDQKHGTNYREERVNLIILTPEQIQLYLDDLANLKISGESEDEDKWIKWIITFRTQMLESQMSFQEAYVGIGLPGLVTDGFACSDIEEIRESTMLMDKSWRLAVNATGVMDALMTENPKLIQFIGLADNKPDFYYSRLDGIYTEIKSNVVAMHRLCGYEVETTYIDRSFMERELNQTQP